MPPPEDAPPPATAWIELPDKRTLILTGDCHIGRSEGNEIVNPDNLISRRHAAVQRQGQHFVLVDFGSINGTYLNESRIFKPTRLEDGDVILVGALRYTFRHPSEAAARTDQVMNTVVAVGKIPCWLLLVTLPEPAAPSAIAWAGQVRPVLERAGAGVKRLPNEALFAHWRASSLAPEKLRALILDLASRPIPAGARLTLHHGAVRVGRATTSAEENLLGTDISYTHKLAATSGTGANFILSEPAARALGPAPFIVPLGAQAIPDNPDPHALFTITIAGPGGGI